MADKIDHAITSLHESTDRILPNSPVKSAVKRSIEDLEHLIALARVEPRFKIADPRLDLTSG